MNMQAAILVSWLLLAIVPPSGAVTLLDPPRQGIQYETLRFRFEESLHLANPFDLVSNQVELRVYQPDLSRAVISFFYDGEADNGAERWEARFSPVQTGEHAVEVVINGAVAARHRVFVSANPGSHQGGLTTGTYPSMFRFSSGEPFRGVGLNVCWSEDYEYYFKKMQSSGITVTRIWMAPWHLSVEWKDTGLGRYNLASARRLDSILTLAHTYGIYVILCMDYHGIARKGMGYFQENRWSDNPYNRANGGPCVNAADLFTSSTAKELFKRKYKYIVSRFGHSPNLAMWEFFNESDLMAGGAIAENRWHIAMGEFVHAVDAHHRLVSSSATRSFPEKIVDAFRSPAMDVVMYHSYNMIDLAPYVADLHETAVEYYGKPVILGEFGVEYRGADRTIKEDPGHVGLHNALWAGWFSETPVAPMSWWWDNYIDPLDLWGEYSRLAAFAGMTSLSGGPLSFSTLPPPRAAGSPAVPVYGRCIINGGEIGLWWKNEHYQWSVMAEQPDCPTLPEFSQTVPGVPPGRYVVRWYDPQTGTTLDSPKEWSTGQSDTLTLTVPHFARDLACVARRIP
jgi:hypothetical protein